jgi:predicted TPR repeat methyltransferase
MDMPALIAKGDAAAAARSWAEAEISYRAALVEDGQGLRALRGLGDALISQQKFADAEAVWRSVVTLAPQQADAQQMLGLILLHRRETEGARVHLSAALALNPNLPKASFNMGHLSYIAGDRASAIAYFQRAHTLAPHDPKALAALTQTLNEVQREPEAAATAVKGLAVLEAAGGASPAALNDIRHHLVHAYRRMGDTVRLVEVYRAAIAADPDDQVAQHLLAAAQGLTTDAHAAAFAKAFFDNLAPNFDTHLVQRLGYGSPTVLTAGLRALRPAPDSFAAVLDLGCGTGLMAEGLATHYALPRLVGLDLSEKMLHEAGKRGRYHHLIAGEVTGATAAMDERFDLVVAADVFIYLGDLAPIHRAVQRVLAPKGLFAFTTEVGTAPSFTLANNGHYKHGVDYLTGLAAATGFTVVRTEQAPIRKEATDTVMGHYIYLEKA